MLSKNIRIIECQNSLYGCTACTLVNSGGGATNFLMCTQCQEGLYLLKNITYVSQYPTYLTTCVPDCHYAHASYVNDPAKGTCQWCGQYSSSCNIQWGSEFCQGENAGAAWVRSTTLTSDLTAI